jgi:hypothetical protein
MSLTESELKYLESVRAQIAALSDEQDKLFKTAQKTLSPRFDELWLEDYLFDYMFNDGDLPRDL